MSELGTDAALLPAQTGTEGGEGADTAAATEGATETEKPQDDTGNEETEKPAEPEKKYTDADMAKVRRKYEKETRAERDERIRAEVRAEMLEKQHGTKNADTVAATADTTELKRPDPDKFETRADYEEALAVYFEDRAVSRVRNEEKHKTVQQQIAATQEEIGKKTTEIFNRGVEEFEDYEEVTSTKNLSLTKPMFDAILDTGENAHRIAVLLGRNKAEQARIAALPPLQQVKEIIALEAKVIAATKPRATGAPPPITKVDAAAVATRDWLDPKLSPGERIEIMRSQAK